MQRFEVEAIDELHVHGPPELMRCELMSPFAWASPDERLHLLIRAVPPAEADNPITGGIWYGMGEPDGLTFRMDDKAVLNPGPGPYDIGGCEDPTVVPVEDELLVYYTGLDANGDGRLLYARGADGHTLEKCGIALDSSKTERNTKEAAVDRTEDGRWRLFYEYSHDCRSKIGLASGDGPKGPWHEQGDPLTAREDKWDSWHLSTGPLLMGDRTAPVMLYNGADRRPEWGIGWVVFKPDCATVVERSDEPLIAPPECQWEGRDFSFAASAILRPNSCIWLYFSRNDHKPFRATIRRNY